MKPCLWWRSRMRPSKRNISKTKIEKEIYKAFALFKNEKQITIADFLKSHDVSLFGGKR
jgi:hypothetical protein